MIAKIVAPLLLLATVGTVQAQDQRPSDLKERILKRVREKLAKEREALLKRVAQIIDEEFAREPVVKKTAPPPEATPEKLREIERKLRILQEKKEQLEAEEARGKRFKADAPVRKLAKDKGPHDAQEAQEMFDLGIERHTSDDFDASIKLFKRIYYNFPKDSIGVISAYNVACGHALAGDKGAALDWLEVSVEGGYTDFEHMRDDADLNSLRKERRYHRLLIDR